MLVPWYCLNPNDIPNLHSQSQFCLSVCHLVVTDKFWITISLFCWRQVALYCWTRPLSRPRPAVFVDQLTDTVTFVRPSETDRPTDWPSGKYYDRRVPSRQRLSLFCFRSRDRRLMSPRVRRVQFEICSFVHRQLYRFIVKCIGQVVRAVGRQVCLSVLSEAAQGIS